MLCIESVEPDITARVTAHRCDQPGCSFWSLGADAVSCRETHQCELGCTLLAADESSALPYVRSGFVLNVYISRHLNCSAMTADVIFNFEMLV